MRFVTNESFSISVESVKDILHANFEGLAVDCGELDWQLCDAIKWLSYHPASGRFAIAEKADFQANQGLVRICFVDCSVTGADIEDEGGVTKGEGGIEFSDEVRRRIFERRRTEGGCAAVVYDTSFFGQDFFGFEELGKLAEQIVAYTNQTELTN